MRLLLKGFDSSGDISCFALVDMTDELRKRILERRELFQMVLSKAPDLDGLRFDDFSAFFYDENSNLDPEGDLDEEDEQQRMKPLLSTREYDRFNCRELIVVPDDFGDNVGEEPDSGCTPNMRYTDNDILVIGKTGFWWEGTDDNGVITTATVEYEKLLSNFDAC